MEWTLIGWPRIPGGYAGELFAWAEVIFCCSERSRRDAGRTQGARNCRDSLFDVGNFEVIWRALLF